MAEKNLHEMLGDQNLRSEYRRRLAHALKVAKGYCGTEREYQDLMETLAELEHWLNGAFGQSEGLRFPENLENEVAEAWQKTGRRKIIVVLELSSGRLSRHISKTLEGKDNADSGLLTMDMEGVVLPPEKGGVRPAGNEGESLEPARFQERVKGLVIALGEKGIHTDDIVLVRGNVRESMMRKVSYAILEIPKLNREVLVCDQVGEATFVIYGIQGRKILMSQGKEKLQERLGACAMKVVYHEPDQWKKEVIGHLLKEVDIAKLRKVDVRSREGLRTEILKLVHTPEVWAGMKYKERLTFKVAGMGLWTIATKFGVAGDPINKRPNHLELGKKIFGEGHGCLEYEERPELTVEQLKAKILKVVTTPESWAGMTAKKKGEFKVVGMGLYAIATKFGVNGKPINSHKVHLELGRKIFGEGHECLEYKERPELTVEQLKAKILKVVTTPESWVEMKYEKKLVFKIANLGLYAIATRFGVAGDPINKRPIYLELGKKIFGEGHECLEKLNLDELIAKILELINTPEAWAEMTVRKKLEIKIEDMGLRAIAKKFGVEGKPTKNHSIHLELGRKIFGEGHECLNMKKGRS